MTSWMQYRIRAKWLEGNLLLAALRLLREPLAEWELLDALHRSFGLSPDERKFGRLVQSLLDRGFLRILGDRGMRRLQISRDGSRLLCEIEKEYEAVVGGL